MLSRIEMSSRLCYLLCASCLSLLLYSLPLSVVAAAVACSASQQKRPVKVQNLFARRVKLTGGRQTNERNNVRMHSQACSTVQGTRMRAGVGGSRRRGGAGGQLGKARGQGHNMMVGRPKNPTASA